MLKKTHKDAIRKKDPRNSTWNSPRRAETLPSEEVIFTVQLAFLETNYEENRRGLHITTVAFVNHFRPISRLKSVHCGQI